MRLYLSDFESAHYSLIGIGLNMYIKKLGRWVGGGVLKDKPCEIYIYSGRRTIVI